ARRSALRGSVRRPRSLTVSGRPVVFVTKRCKITAMTVATPKRHPLRLASLVAGGFLLVAALAALVLFLWLRTYSPLDAAGSGGFAPGPGLGADVEPVTGSGGKTVFIPAYRKNHPFDTAFTVHNTGRFAVTVTGLVKDR